MSSPTAFAGTLRGALVGICSAALSAVAHGTAGGEVPGGGSLVLVMLACAAVGAVSSSVFAEEQGHQLLLLSGALVAGQAVGHVALVAASDAGFHCPAAFSPQMLLAHGLAAPVCALLISLVEHLYVVCASTLCWLRLNFVNEYRPAAVVLRWPTKSVVVQRLVFAPGGTRAPPQPACA